MVAFLLIVTVYVLLIKVNEIGFSLAYLFFKINDKTGANNKTNIIIKFLKLL